MKKIGLLLVSLILLSMPAMARNIEVEALSDFSTDNPPKHYSVKIVNDVYMEKGTLQKESIVEGKIIVKDAARLKRDATFKFVPLTLTEPDGNVIKIKTSFIGRYSKEIDKAQIAKAAALGAGNMMVKGFSTGYRAIEGAVKNEEGNRLKSSAVAVYESTPISYIKKGNALEIKQGERFFINFKQDNEE